MELEEAIKILNDMRSWDCKEPDSKCVEAIEIVLSELDSLKFKYQARKDRTDTIIKKQEKMIDELKNKVHYQSCLCCGKEIRVKRTDAKYCEECAKSKQKDYFKNMSDEKKKERAEKSKIYMRELRAKRKAEESE